MEELAARDPAARGAARQRARRGAGELGRGARAALVLFLLLLPALAQDPSGEDLWRRLAGPYGANRHGEVVALWQELAPRADSTARYWPYAALMAGESMLRETRWREAHALIDHVREACPSPGVVVDAHLHAMRGRLHVIEGRFDLAEPEIARALELAPAVRAQGEWAWNTVRYTHMRASELALARNRDDEVEALVEGFLRDADLYTGAPLDRAVLVLNLAAALDGRAVYAQEVPLRAAETLAELVERLQELTPSPERDRLLARAQCGRARAALDAGDLEDAAGRLAQARELLASRGAGAPSEEDALRLALQVRLALARGDGPTLLHALRDELPAIQEAQLARLARLPELPGGLGLLHFVEVRDLLLEAVRLDAALDGERAGAERGLERIARVQGLSGLSRSLGARSATVSEVREQLLDDAAGLLLYLPSMRSSLVLAVDRETIHCEEVAGLGRLQHARTTHLEMLRAGLPADADAREAALAAEREAARTLSAMLLPPRVTRHMSGWSRLTVCGLDVLGPVAFGWLPIEGAAHLGLRLAWDVLPSLPFGVARGRAPRPAASARRTELLLVGDARPSAADRREHSELAPLPLSGETARRLGRPYRSFEVLAGESATPERVLASLPEHDVVQFLVHAVDDPARPRPTGLVLSAHGEHSGVLWGEDVAASGQRAEAPSLVLLTACRSAQGPLRRGDAGSSDLAGAWLAAGASAVLASHTDLAWGPTIELSRGFHEHLRGEASSPAEALRRALAEHRVVDERELPFRYGVLEVVGLGHRPPFERGTAGEARSRRVPPFLVAGGVVLIGLAVAARRRARSAGPRRSATDPSA